MCMKESKILRGCTENICRSPLAERMMRRERPKLVMQTELEVPYPYYRGEGGLDEVYHLSPYHTCEERVKSHTLI
ncbi:MAG: hypothetical protein FDW93_02970 [Bergeyella sp.]|nr:hypothetical protein [Bergeyella sp.]